MTWYTIAEAADLLGVSTDTVRRWAGSGRVASRREEGRPRLIDGADLAHFAETLAGTPGRGPTSSQSARNHLTGIVTRVVRDKVMAQVEIQAGRQRIVSLISREAADELALLPGVLVVAAIKATNVVVELPEPR